MVVGGDVDLLGRVVATVGRVEGEVGAEVDRLAVLPVS